MEKIVAAWNLHPSNDNSWGKGGCIYLDTPDHRANEFIKEAGTDIHVFSESPIPDSPYIQVIGAFPSNDSARFVKAMSLFADKMIEEGHTDFYDCMKQREAEWDRFNQVIPWARFEYAKFDLMPAWQFKSEDPERVIIAVLDTEYPSERHCFTYHIEDLYDKYGITDIMKRDGIYHDKRIGGKFDMFAVRLVNIPKNQMDQFVKLLPEHLENLYKCSHNSHELIDYLIDFETNVESCAAARIIILRDGSWNLRGLV